MKQEHFKDDVFMISLNKFVTTIPLVIGTSILKTTTLALNLAETGIGCEGSQRTIPGAKLFWSGPVIPRVT